MTRSLVRLLTAVVLVWGLGDVAEAATITLSPFDGKDAQIADGAVANTNFGNDGRVVINWFDNLRSIGLIEFDLSAIPNGSVITSASLSLFHELNVQTNARYDVFRVTSAWTESTVTFNTAPTFDPAAFSSLIFSGPSDVYRDWDVTALVQGWVSGSFSNFGLWVEEIPVQGTATAYFSSSDGLDSRRPILTVTFESTAVPEPMSLGLIGTGLAGLMLRRRALRRSQDR